MSQVISLLTDMDLNSLVDGQADPHRAAAITAALEADPAARARVEAWRKQNEVLRTLFAAIVFEPVPVRLMPKNLAKAQAAPASASGARPHPLRAHLPTQEPPARTEARRHSAPTLASTPIVEARRNRSTSMTGIAVAAFCLGIAASFGAARFELGPRVLSSLHLVEDLPIPSGREIAKRAAEAHQAFATDLNRPVEIPASDEAHLVKWIQHRLTMPIRIPDLRHQGWNLLGGRVVPGELGPAAFLLYGNGVERLGFYIARSNASQADEFTTYGSNDGGPSVGYWIDEPFGYAITTSRGTHWLERNGPALFDSVKAQARDNASAF